MEPGFDDGFMTRQKLVMLCIVTWVMNVVLFVSLVRADFDGTAWVETSGRNGPAESWSDDAKMASAVGFAFLFNVGSILGVVFFWNASSDSEGDA